MEQQEITNAIATIIAVLKQQGTSPHTIKRYQNSYNVFERYLRDNGIKQVNDAVCLEYISFKIGIKYERFECVTANTKANDRMRPLLLLLRYLEGGQINRGVRRTQPLFICPACFRREYEAFCEELVYRGNSDETIRGNREKVQDLIAYLTAQNIAASEDITPNAIDGFLKTYKGKAVKTMEQILYALRNYFAFLHDHGYTTRALAPLLPKTRVPRNGSIPYAWSKSDIQKLLNGVPPTFPTKPTLRRAQVKNRPFCPR